MDAHKPDARTIVFGLTDRDDGQRRQHNQIAAEFNGHIQAVPLTSAGLSQLRLLKDVLSRNMAEKGIPPSIRADVLASSPALTLQGQQTRLEIAAVRPVIQELLIQRARQEEARFDWPSDN